MILPHQTSRGQRSSPGAGPSHVVILHGFLGTKRNWFSFARELAVRRPDACITCLDLPGHGDAAGSLLPSQASIRACAAEVCSTVQTLLGTGPVSLAGHSLGGKVALLAGLQLAEAGQLAGLWLLDSAPGSFPPASEAQAMLHALRATDHPFAQRQFAIAALQDHGIAEPVAQWVATNLRRETPDGPYRWPFDLAALEALLADYLQLDAWEPLSQLARNVPVHLVRATRNSLLTGADVQRLASMGLAVSVHTIDADHWVHISGRSALLGLMSERL